jgi:hypothetical protein
MADDPLAIVHPWQVGRERRHPGDAAYPEQLPALAKISYAFTKLKYVSATASMPLVLVGLAALVIRRLLRKRDDGSSSPFARRQ